MPGSQQVGQSIDLHVVCASVLDELERDVEQVMCW
jgi:hypothetical protein